MKGEKLTKMIHWPKPSSFRHAQRHQTWLQLLSNNAALITPTLLLFFVFLLFLLTAKYAGYSSEDALQLFSSKQNSSREFPLDCAAWNHTNSCPKNCPNSPNFSHKPSRNPQTCPEYFRWIHQDLRYWKQTGITKQNVEKARKSAHFRLTILNGKVYVEKFRDSIQSRALFTMWGIMQLVRLYPGQLPDLELMFDCDDRPVVPENQYRHSPSEAPPLFRYCSDWRSMDIVFPDWSFWGWAETNIWPWRFVLKDIKAGNERIKWEDREPYAYWKGNPHVAPWRADLMKCNLTTWNTHLYLQDWAAEAQKGYKESNLGDQCTHRYKIYIEGWAWSVSEKYILACDSPTLLMTLRWYDFFIRGMIPQRHYWPVRETDKCKSTKFAVEWGNNHTQQAKAIGEAGSRFIHEDMNMEYVYDYMFHLLTEYAKLLKYKPTIPPNAKELCSEFMACPATGNWRKFMEASLEISPRNSTPCILPPSYEPQELEALIRRSVEATKEVEAWENEYWDKQNQNR